MKRYLPLAAIIVCISCAFVWQTTPAAKKNGPVKPLESKRISDIFDFSLRDPENRKAVDILLQAPVSAAPYTLDEKNMQHPLHPDKTVADRAITYLANDERGMFSREPMRRYEYTAHLRVSGTDLIVYRMANTYSEDRPVYYMIATIDSARNLVDKTDFSRIASPLSYTTGSIDADGLITATEYKVIWQNDPLKTGYKDNKVIARNAVKVIRQRITSDGHFETVREDKAVVKVN